MLEIPEIKIVKEAHITDKKLFIIVEDLKSYHTDTFAEDYDSVIAFNEDEDMYEVHLHLDQKINNIIDEMDEEDEDFDLRDLEYVKSVLAEVEDKGFDFFILRKE